MLTVRIIEMSGDDAEEVRDAAARFAPAASNGPAAPIMPTTPTSPHGVLTQAEVERWWKNTRSEAQRVPAMVAKHPDGTPFDEVLAALGLPNGQALSGRTSSIGHAMRRFFPGRPEPLHRNRPLRRYEMNSQIAAVILRLANGEM